MEDLILIKPNESYAEEIIAFRNEFLKTGSSMDGCGSLRRHSNPKDWLNFNRILEDKETVPDNWVQSSQYIYVRKADRKIIGMIQVRHYFNDYLEKFAGNIGYSIRPSERRKGYATSMLHDFLPFCKVLGLNKILISCEENNEGSRKTIIANGGVYESTVLDTVDNEYLQRYWIDLEKVEPKKELSEMTLEELWQLFPIILKEHNPKYKDWYEIEKNKLMDEFGQEVLRINHIGSTSVKGLIAKPTVDILMEISKETNINELKQKLLSMGWLLMNSTTSPKFRQTYNKGYTKMGFAEKVYHLHVRYRDDWNELYFRDYLREYPEVAKEYGKLKLSIFKKYEHDRDGYTEAKSDFILKITEKARGEYGNRYI